MWIDKLKWLADRQDRLKLEADLAAAKELVGAQKATTEFLMLRVTQLEAERNKLLWTFAGVKFPELMVAAEPAGEKSGFENPLNALPSFDDMGDHEAKKQGIDWNADGQLIFGKQNA